MSTGHNHILALPYGCVLDNSMLTAALHNQSADIVVDAHVHIYPFMSIQVLLEAAGRNLFGHSERSAGVGCGLLLVADPEGVDGFDRLLTLAERAPSSNEDRNWLPAEADSSSVTFRRPCGASIIALRGQQLISREGLEVLGAGYGNALPSGLPLADMVERIGAAGGHSIIAWGAGKWLGRRGRLVSDLIVAESGRPDIMLADNGGRPWCWYRVPQFEAAAETGMRVLAGTDPLPLKGEEKRVGSYGFRVRIERTDPGTLADSFWQALERPETTIDRFGTPMAISGFVSNQLRVRMQGPAGQQARP